MRNLIIIPCYNEANRLKFDAFQDFLNSHSDYQICFVNDGSKDGTLEQLTSFGNKNKEQVIVHDMPQNGGKAEAVRGGMNHVLENYEVDTIGFIDADLATGFDDYKTLVKTLKSDDLKMVVGSRKMETAQNIDRSAFRLFASWLIGTMINLIIGLPIKDTQCGAKVFTPKTAQYLFNRSFMSRWLFDVEMFIRMKNLYQKNTMNCIREVAVIDWEEVDGSHITFQDSLKFPKELLEIGYTYNIQPTLSSIMKPQIPVIKTNPTRQAA